MTLANLGTQIEKFNQRSHDLMGEFEKLSNDTKEKVDAGYKGHAERDEELSALKQKAEIELQRMKENILSAKSTVKETEIEKINALELPVTADLVAELSLLATVKLTDEEYKKVSK